MKKNLLVLIFLIFGGISCLTAQTNLQGINYQGVARDANGKLLASSELSFRLSLVSKPNINTPQVHFSEIHKVITNELGLFQFIIGSGEIESGNFENIPWAAQSIFLQTELATASTQKFELLNRTELLAVPYAYYAVTANELISDNTIELPIEKNQSIHWTTGGNSKTDPRVHFVGTTDNQPLVFKTNNIIALTLTTNGRLELSNRTPSGPDSLKSSYPVVVEGTLNTQGIWIEINGTRSDTTSFLTFVEQNDKIVGQVKGQTLAELEVSDLYIYTSAIFALNITAVSLNIGALIAETVNNFIKGWGVASGIVTAAKTVTYIIQLTSLGLAFDFYLKSVRSKEGVIYSSGGGDYAEWIKRKPYERDFQIGEIVCLDSGMVSLNTRNAKQLMVISKDPIILGNEPSAAFADQYEKVAFVGQVLVKTVGTVKIGDYILPSGNNDGCGVAIHPSKMKAGDYERIVGIAWEAAEEGLLNYINVAVGINHNDLANKLDELNQRVDHMIAYLDGKTDLNPVLQKAQLENSLQQKPSSKFEKAISDEEFDQFLDKNQLTVRNLFSMSREQMKQQGYDELTLQKFDQTFADPIKMIKTLRRDPMYLTYWNKIDENIIQSNK